MEERQKKPKKENTKTIGDLVFFGHKELVNTASSRIEAEMLLSYVTKQNKLTLYQNWLHKVDRSSEFRYKQLLKKRANGTPLSYLTNKREFFAFSFFVNQNTLIPRHETEILVEEAIAQIKKYPIQPVKMVEIGTGSGAISIALVHHCYDIQIDALDISEEALYVAKENARNHQMLHRIHFFQSNLFNEVPELRRYHFVVSNPPYIPNLEIPSLSREVQAEPRIALDGGKDGLEVITSLIKQSKKYLVPGGCLLFEIGYQQKPAVLKLMKQSGFANLFVKDDLSGIPRVVGGFLLT